MAPTISLTCLSAVFVEFISTVPAVRFALASLEFTDLAADIAVLISAIGSLTAFSLIISLSEGLFTADNNFVTGISVSRSAMNISAISFSDKVIFCRLSVSSKSVL